MFPKIHICFWLICIDNWFVRSVVFFSVQTCHILRGCTRGQKSATIGLDFDLLSISLHFFSSVVVSFSYSSSHCSFSWVFKVSATAILFLTVSRFLNSWNASTSLVCWDLSSITELKENKTVDVTANPRTTPRKTIK